MGWLTGQQAECIVATFIFYTKGNSILHGWRGKLLKVNLSTGKISMDPLDPQVAKDYIGGWGLGIYLMNQEMDPCWDPLSPENMLIMATGPLTGTKAPTGARYMVMTKSPLTGGHYLFKCRRKISCCLETDRF